MVRRELADPAYSDVEPNALERLWEQLRDLLDASAGSAPGVVVAVTFLVLVVLGVALVAARAGAPRLVQRTTAGSAVGADASLSAAHYRSSAEAAAAAGDWAAATREGYRALVRSLEERGDVAVDPGRTADEVARAAGVAAPEHRAALVEAARAFDDVTYGGRAGTQELYGSVRDLDQALARRRAAVAG